MTDRRVKLYYFPASYYSQKALIAAQEKEVKYEPVIINIHGPDGGEQCTAAYMRRSANKGKVPVLQDGEKVITESEDIVDYIDREFPADTKLVPDLSTEIGREVAKWRKELDAVPIEAITFGLMGNPDLSVSGLQIPAFMRKKGTDPSKELWLCGQQFTAADINLCILMGRLDLLGLAGRYHNAEKRPRLHAYWEAAKKRPTVNRVTVRAIREMMKMNVKKGLKNALPYLGGLVTVGLAAGLAFVFAQKR